MHSNITLLGDNTYSSVPSGDAASDVTGPTVMLNDSLNDSIVVELVETKYCIFVDTHNVCICLCICVYACMCVYKCVHTCLHAGFYTYICVSTYVCMSVCV